jgi:hypothetical protein
MPQKELGTTSAIYGPIFNESLSKKILIYFNNLGKIFFWCTTAEVLNFFENRRNIEDKIARNSENK